MARVMVNSFWRSRISACCFVSPGSTLPPTNSQSMPLALLVDRRQITNLSLSQIMAAAASVLSILRFDEFCHTKGIFQYFPKLRIRGIPRRSEFFIVHNTFVFWMFFRARPFVWFLQELRRAWVTSESSVSNRRLMTCSYKPGCNMVISPLLQKSPAKWQGF